MCAHIAVATVESTQVETRWKSKCITQVTCAVTLRFLGQNAKQTGNILFVMGIKGQIHLFTNSQTIHIYYFEITEELKGKKEIAL